MKIKRSRLWDRTSRGLWLKREAVRRYMKTAKGKERRRRYRKSSEIQRMKELAYNREWKRRTRAPGKLLKTWYLVRTLKQEMRKWISTN